MTDRTSRRLPVTLTLVAASAAVALGPSTPPVIAPDGETFRFENDDDVSADDYPVLAALDRATQLELRE